MSANRVPKLLAVALVALAPLLVIYLMTAFVLWEMHPAAWSESARFFTALLGLMVSIGASAAYQGIA